MPLRDTNIRKKKRHLEKGVDHLAISKRRKTEEQREETLNGSSDVSKTAKEERTKRKKKQSDVFMQTRKQRVEVHTEENGFPIKSHKTLAINMRKKLLDFHPAIFC